MLTSVQPRIRLGRSFDQRSHTYLGYALRVCGNMGSETREFLVGVGESAHAKHQIQVGATVSGEALPVADPRLEIVEFYKVSNLKVAVRKVAEATPPPPWRGVAPPLSVYRERGHRRLAARTYEEKCTTCLWGCQMAVEMIIDQWNPSKRRYRTETFCYGPRSRRIAFSVGQPELFWEFVHNELRGGRTIEANTKAVVEREGERLQVSFGEERRGSTFGRSFHQMLKACLGLRYLQGCVQKQVNEDRPQTSQHRESSTGLDALAD